MKIVVACDSFKEALESPQVCRAIARGIRQSFPDAHVVELPMADGGEGTSKILGKQTGSSQVTLLVNDPLFRMVRAEYYITPDGKTAFLDMAQASGLDWLDPHERDPIKTSTYGTGELIGDAVARGVENIVIGIGGSATNDGGIGMATALGYRFVDSNGQVLRGCGGDLVKIDRIEGGLRWNDEEISLKVLCDVVNPLFGPNGAARIYGGQKGADAAKIKHLDEGLRHLAARVIANMGISAEDLPGAGAAGGLGYGLHVFLGAEMKSGVQTVIEYVGLSDKLTDADLLITGEGRLDRQTSSGKLITGLAQLCKNRAIPVIALCGILDATDQDLRDLGLYAAYTINPPGMSIKQALLKTSENLTSKSAEVIKAYFNE